MKLNFRFFFVQANKKMCAWQGEIRGKYTEGNIRPHRQVVVNQSYSKTCGECCLFVFLCLNTKTSWSQICPLKYIFTAEKCIFKQWESPLFGIFCDSNAQKECVFHIKVKTGHYFCNHQHSFTPDITLAHHFACECCCLPWCVFPTPPPIQTQNIYLWMMKFKNYKCVSVFCWLDWKDAGTPWCLHGWQSFILSNKNKQTERLASAPLQQGKRFKNSLRLTTMERYNKYTSGFSGTNIVKRTWCHCNVYLSTFWSIILLLQWQIVVV